LARTIDLDELERLIQLRRAGALREAEFSTDVMTLVQDSRPPRRGALLLILGLAAGLVCGGGGFWALRQTALADVSHAQPVGPAPRAD
jgi:hypothetical protein